MIEEQNLDNFNNLKDEEKIILYSLGVLDNMPIKNKIKLQKLLFMTSNVFEDYGDLLDFEPHLYGPYSKNLDDMLENLIKIGFVSQTKSQYKLTPLGEQVYLRLSPKKGLVSVLEDFKSFINDLTNDELLTFIYVTYPNFTTEAIKWNELKEKRVQCAVQLLKKQKISFAKAVEISGLPRFDFELLSKNEGIKWKI